MPSGVFNSDKRRSPKMLGTISILNWVPDIDEIKETLDGTVPPNKNDVLSRGGQQWPMKPE